MPSFASGAPFGLEKYSGSDAPPGDLGLERPGPGPGPDLCVEFSDLQSSLVADLRVIVGTVIQTGTGSQGW